MKTLIVFNRIDNSVCCVLASIDEIEVIHFDEKTMFAVEMDISDIDGDAIYDLMLKDGELVPFEFESVDINLEDLAQDYLDKTDYLVNKFVEDNRRKIPVDVKENRKKCRAILSASIPSADFLLA